jgi:hypothetical protein
MAIADLQQKINENGLIDNWARITVQALIKNLERYSIGVTQELKDSIKYVIVKDGQNWVDRITFSFNIYGRFVDMGVGRGVPLGAIKEAKIMQRALNEKRTMGPHRKKKPWEGKGFTAQAFRLQELIAEMLQDSVTTEVADTLSKIPFVINRLAA